MNSSQKTYLTTSSSNAVQQQQQQRKVNNNIILPVTQIKPPSQLVGSGMSQFIRNDQFYRGTPNATMNIGGVGDQKITVSSSSFSSQHNNGTLVGSQRQKNINDIAKFGNGVGTNMKQPAVSFKPTKNSFEDNQFSSFGFNNIPSSDSNTVSQHEYNALKNEFQRYKRESEEKILQLENENNQLREKERMRTVEAERHRRERPIAIERLQRRQREQEELDMHRQYEYMVMMDCVSQQEQQVQQQQSSQPNVDNMTYEELLNLQDQIGFVSRGLKQEDIDKIPETKFRKCTGREKPMCSICQSEFESSEKIKKLQPCSHAYHSPCIGQWLLNEKTCPVCKTIVVVQ